MFKTGDSSLVSFVLYSVIGIVLGALTNKASTFLDKEPLALTQKNLYLGIFVKLVMACAVLFFIEKSEMGRTFAFDWQTTTPGLLFVLFYFGVQINTLTAIVSSTLTVLK